MPDLSDRMGGRWTSLQGVAVVEWGEHTKYTVLSESGQCAEPQALFSIHASDFIQTGRAKRSREKLCALEWEREW